MAQKTTKALSDDEVIKIHNYSKATISKVD